MWASGSVKIPTHIAVIPDGNRRYAKKTGLDFYHAYKKGVEKVRSFLTWALEFRNIKNVTFFALSTENLKRSKIELEILFRIFEEELRRTLEDPLIHDNKVRVRFIGDRSLLPGRVVKYIDELESVTKNYSNYHLTIALGYGGRAEIVRCIKRVLSGEVRLETFSEEELFQCLDTRGIPNPEPDVVVRTGGEKRLSNFLLYQTAYSELIFLDKLWPEVEREDLVYIIEEYSRRQRRFGR
ncbi:polyprenyl diphosphate synthase [Pyrobaculum aerophilum]|uniref:Tritrans,polycis-undecaprenyl-diphosphate synthase (geranylgeranyl-diphosphate specific) n=1 Tax=Pyrobaculum aerophilum TaxID=13773 RepID=A0A371QUD0_9CREN|nr:polyprenyl diphosphate synthase [Pyrobaculum aerophilum]RFA92952.1 di-trans,poly-cis-decaprenylcistransferase [Pyrobaculum aerophilum]RFB00350.1 di-trans,poly-cis-decaprenylcistransferase [Pyrobaculum aerophilum]